jgi:hypothetical protein
MTNIDILWSEDESLRESYQRRELAKQDLKIARNGLFKKIFKKAAEKIEGTVERAVSYNDNLIRERILQLEKRGINVIRYDGADTII